MGYVKGIKEPTERAPDGQRWLSQKIEQYYV